MSGEAGRRASRLVPRLAPRLGSIPDKAGRRASRHPISWAFFYFAHHLIPSRSSSRVLVSSGRLASCRLVPSHQMRRQASKTTGASRHRSRPSCPGIRAAGVPSLWFSWRSPVVSSSPHPLIHGKQASGGRTGQPRGAGGDGNFFQAAEQRHGVRPSTRVALPRSVGWQ